jgi:uncharacterized Zn finger protein (UPF0148 family)
MIVFGWGRGSNVLGELGEIECPNCDNCATWQVVEASRKATVYFLPVAKWDLLYFAVCPICSNGFQIETREEAQDLLLQALEGQETSRILGQLLREIDSGDS